MTVDAAKDAVIAAARKVRRGCDCEYGYRCGNCDRLIDLIESVEKYDTAVTAVPTQAEPTFTLEGGPW